MGKRGPAKKPTALAILHGDKKDRINTDAPVADEGTPEPPIDMTPDAREAWDRVVAELAAMGILSTADRDALVVYIEAIVAHDTITRALADNSDPLIPGNMGGLVRNPLYAMKRDAGTLVRIMAREFGLTPSARSDIHVGAKGGRAGDGPERLLS